MSLLNSIEVLLVSAKWLEVGRHNRLIAKIGFASMLLLPVPYSFSQEESEDLENLSFLSLDELLEVPVTAASKFEKTVNEAPALVSVLTKDEIDKFSWQSINEVLYRLPGFGPGQDFDRRTVPFRGASDSWSNNHLLHLIDGIPVNDNFYGTAYTWELTPLDWTDSLEIIRGPGSPLYGSNATNGVIHMNTLKVSEMSSPVTINVDAGSLDSQSFSIVAGQSFSSLDALFSYKNISTDGNEYFSVDGSGRTSSSGELQSFATNDSRDTQVLFTKLHFNDDLDGLSFYYLWQDWEFETNFGWLWWIPDEHESMSEDRSIYALKYVTDDNNFTQEYILRYQKHNIDWVTRYYPAGAFGQFYPKGMWEYLETDGEDWFARAQFSWTLDDESTFLLGVEGDYFIYDGDAIHQSNVNIDGDGAPPFENNEIRNLGPWLDFILDEPLVNSAIYLQYVSANMLPDTEVTIGGRWDRLRFDFRQIEQANQPKDSRSFSKFSPRLSVVHRLNEKTSLKFIAGKAFRAPMPTELAGAHTFHLASNINQLEPETLTTFDAALDMQLNDSVTLRTNLFRTNFENQIAFSTANNNLSTNVFSLDTEGLEAELLFEYLDFSGFANLSYTRKRDEQVLDNTIARADDLVWEPEWKFNFGLSYSANRWLFSLSGHYHGRVERRSSELGTQLLPLGVDLAVPLEEYRPDSLGSWFVIDAHIRYRLNQHLDLGIYSRNSFDTDDNRLVKSGPFPFDYQQEERRVNAYAKYRF